MSDHTAQLKIIKDELLAMESPLADERRRNKVFPVIGEGDHYAKIMFIGEAPGKNEAKTGKPFCGASGRILDELLASVGIDRKGVYVTNIVKDRPTDNRDPLPSEIDAYGPFLDRQIIIIEPKIIATLGRFSMDYIMKKFGLGAQLQSISQMHGKTFEVEVSYGTLTVIPLYHPAAAIYNQHLKDTLKKDFEALKKYK
ncbi:MAG: uracil-DNA glycosylase [Candidatus Pacebacteria bacterium]|nr:uracil-DNA glycosylase [Candidatus Paceibacterota bacterium]